MQTTRRQSYLSREMIPRCMMPTNCWNIMSPLKAAPRVKELSLTALQQKTA